MEYIIGIPGLIATIFYLTKWIKARKKQDPTKGLGKRIGISFVIFMIGVMLTPTEEVPNEVVQNASGVVEESKDDSSQEQTEKLEESEEITTFNVNWEQAIAEVKEELTNPEFFSYVKDIDIQVDDTKKQISFTAVLEDATSEDVALDFADTIIRRFNATAQIQDGNIKSGTKDYLGGLYDEYSIMIGISPFSKVDESKNWYVFDAIAKGVQRQPKLQ